MLPQLEKKYDYKQALKALLNPPVDRPEFVTVPSMQYLMLEGTGSPNDNPVFEAAIGALYGCAYGIKFARKKAGIEPEYSVQPLEGLWWVEGMDPAKYLEAPQSQWRWRLMIGQPDFIDSGELVLVQAAMKKKGSMPIASDWNTGRRVFVFSAYTSAPTAMNIQASNRCTNGRGGRAINSTGCTMKFTWATHEKPRRRS